MATYTKRGDKWFVQVARKGVRKSASFAKKYEAEVWANALENAIIAGEITTDKQLTIADMVNSFTAEMGPFALSKMKALRTVASEFGQYAVATFDHKLITAYLLRRRASGIQDTSSSHVITYLVQVLRFSDATKVAVPSGFFDRLKFALNAIKYRAASSEAGQRVSDADLAKIKAALYSEVPSELLDFAVDTAMRLSEIVRLRWSDIDLTERTAVIRDRKHPREKYGNHQLVPLLGRSAAILASRPKSGDGPWPYSTDFITQAWARAKRKAGLTARFHDLRHEGISRLFSKGFTIEQVALVSGHRDWKMLRRYTKITPADLLARQALPKIALVA